MAQKRKLSFNLQNEHVQMYGHWQYIFIHGSIIRKN